MFGFVWSLTGLLLFVTFLFLFSKRPNKKQNISEIFKKTQKWRKEVNNFNFSHFFSKCFSEIPFLFNHILYLLIAMVFFRDKVTEFTKFYDWPLFLTLIFYMICFFQLDSTFRYISLIFDYIPWINKNYIFLFILVTSILLYLCVSFGDTILIYFSDKTRGLLQGHILETSMHSYYHDPYHSIYQNDYKSIAKFFNEWEDEKVEYAKGLRYSDHSLIFYFDKIEKEMNKTSDETQRYFLDAKVKFIDDQSKWKEITPFRDWFPLHKNCNLTPYADALEYFRDVYESISKAELFIYITGKIQ
jgi:hypothetical protein